VVVYKLDKATAWIVRNVFHFAVQYISLVNLILEEQVYEISHRTRDGQTFPVFLSAVTSLRLPSVHWFSIYDHLILKPLGTIWRVIQVVPEFIQDDAEPANVANAAFDLLPLSASGHRNILLDGYSRLLPLLGKPGVVKRTAQYILNSMTSNGEC
jgi:lipid A disaccharide synthetase